MGKLQNSRLPYWRSYFKIGGKFKNHQSIKLVIGSFQNEVTPFLFDEITVFGYLDSSKPVPEEELHIKITKDNIHLSVSNI